MINFKISEKSITIVQLLDVMNFWCVSKPLCSAPFVASCENKSVELPWTTTVIVPPLFFFFFFFAVQSHHCIQPKIIWSHFTSEIEMSSDGHILVRVFCYFRFSFIHFLLSSINSIDLYKWCERERETVRRIALNVHNVSRIKVFKQRRRNIDNEWFYLSFLHGHT